jgi:hypothetical protein
MPVFPKRSCSTKDLEPTTFSLKHIPRSPFSLRPDPCVRRGGTPFGESDLHFFRLRVGAVINKLGFGTSKGIQGLSGKILGSLGFVC